MQTRSTRLEHTGITKRLARPPARRLNNSRHKTRKETGGMFAEMTVTWTWPIESSALPLTDRPRHPGQSERKPAVAGQTRAPLARIRMPPLFSVRRTLPLGTVHDKQTRTWHKLPLPDCTKRPVDSPSNRQNPVLRVRCSIRQGGGRYRPGHGFVLPICLLEPMPSRELQSAVFLLQEGGVCTTGIIQ